MLLQDPLEIDHLIPSSKVSKIDKLVSRLEAEEMNSLYPLVGKPLLDQLIKDYAELSQAEGGGIWVKCERDDKENTRITILRTAQEVLLYSYLANHSAILQSSFNLGGGWNSPSTGDYEALDSKANERLDKDLWHSARRAKENLLLLLEMDARNKQVYTKLWKESDYFYKHNDLLFTTAAELHPLYINLGDCPHIAFQQYVSVLHDCQDGYIAGTIGYTLLQALIDRKYHAASEQTETEQEEEKEDEQEEKEEEQEKGQEDVEALENDEENTLNPAVWKSIDRHIRMALANFATYEQEGAKHEHLRNRGQSQLSIATRIINQNYGMFHEFLMDSPLYQPDYCKKNDKHHHHHSHHKHPHPHPQPDHCPKKDSGTVFSLLH